MNKLLETVLGAIIITSAIIMTQYGFHYNDYRYQTYFSHHDGFSVNKILGIIPFSYLEDYDEEILEERYPYSLTNVIDLKAPIYCYEIMFYNRESKPPRGRAVGAFNGIYFRPKGLGIKPNGLSPCD